MVLMVISFGVIIFLLNRRSGNNQNDQSMVMLQNQINEITKTLDNKLGQSNQMFQQQFGQTHQVIKDVIKEVTEVKETGRQMVNFADQLQKLQDILKNPKQRGVLGEYYLETLLKNVLPPDSYKMQYKFKDGEIVDAAIFVKDKIVPIDSKFSLENYNRLTEEKDQIEKDKLEKQFINDLKLRIQETGKYIRPNEGTMEFAFMFIPHEAIYYDLLINKIGAVTGDTETIIQRAAGKYKVIIVSPTNLLAYLQTVLQGLKGMQIQEQTQEILKNVDRLKKHLSTYGDYHSRLGKNLSTTVNMYNASSDEFKKIDKDVVKLVGGESDAEFIQIDKPRQDE
jgi:DNA recombination protein RmuC